MPIPVVGPAVPGPPQPSDLELELSRLRALQGELQAMVDGHSLSYRRVRAALEASAPPS